MRNEGYTGYHHKADHHREEHGYACNKALGIQGGEERYKA